MITVYGAAFNDQDEILVEVLSDQASHRSHFGWLDLKETAVHLPFADLVEKDPSPESLSQTLGTALKRVMPQGALQTIGQPVIGRFLHPANFCYHDSLVVPARFISRQPLLPSLCWVPWSKLQKRQEFCLPGKFGDDLDLITAIKAVLIAQPVTSPV
jgi:hypothetical protein